MQTTRYFMNTVGELARADACLFTPSDLRQILPKHSDSAFKTLLSRAVREKHLTKLCRGLYLYEKANPDRGSILQHAAAKLRPLGLNYLSLETVLSDAGVISQIPMNRITLMSSGRSSLIDCGTWGSIEFIKTTQKPKALTGQLTYDPKAKLWRAHISQAIRDMKATHRSLDLIDWKLAHEFI